MKTGKRSLNFKSELAGLAETDPDFFEYLKNEEADVLEFSDGDDDELLSEGADDELLSEGDDYELLSEGADDELLSEGDDDELLSEGDDDELLSEGDDDELLSEGDDDELLGYLAKVLADPAQHRPALAKAVKVAVDCFKACVCSLGGGGGSVSDGHKRKGKDRRSSKLDSGKSSAKVAKTSITSKFVVKNEQVFDEVIRLCFAHLGRCFMILMNPLEKKSVNKNAKRKVKKAGSTTFKNWHKYGALTKQYLNALSTLLSELQHNDEVICEALNTVSGIVDLYLHFPKISKQLIKTTVKLWSRRNEAVQSAAFIVLCKYVRLDNDSFVLVYKNCYVSYVSNSKQVNAETRPLIEFMQKCFVELSFLVPKLAYDYAFVYIRQFAIHLRSAIMGKKKDLIQTVYNWQFLNGLSLWTLVVSQSTKDHANFAWFRDLRHPLVEIISLLKRSFMSSKYVPLGIFCVRLMLRMQTECRIFIPTLAMSVEMLDQMLQIDKSKPAAGKGAQKEVDATEVARFSKLQLMDAGVRSTLAEQLFKVCLESAEALKHHPAFPEILVPIEPKIKNFVKKCRNPEHVELFKSLLRKLNAQAAEIKRVVAASAIDVKDYEIGGFNDIFREKNPKRERPSAEDVKEDVVSKKFKFK